MRKVAGILNYLFIMLIITSLTACGSSKKSSTYNRKKQASHVNASQLGRNKYYFSSGYQKKLSRRPKTKR